MPNKIGGMATIPERIESLQQVLESVSKQVDILYLYLNNYTVVPSFIAKFNNVYPILGKDYYGDLNATGKMIYLDLLESDSYCFTFDDDVIYPDNYISYLTDVISSFNNKVALAVHGSITADHASWYYERHHIFYGGDKLHQHMAINLAGSGCFAYHSSAVKMQFDAFLEKVFVDLNISLSCLQQNVPLLAVKRDENWLTFIKHKGLWHKFSKILTHHTRIISETEAWKLDNVKNVWYSFLSNHAGGDWFTYSTENKLDTDMCNFAMGGPVPLLWRTTQLSIQQLMRSYGVIYPSKKTGSVI